MSRPNLFSIATSELSQDAFICWLLSWADPKCAAIDPLLHKNATDFLNALFDCAAFPRPDVYWKVVAKRQVERIDIFVEINDTIPMIIEDKTNTKNHSDQLAIYKSRIAQKYNTSDFPAIYLKTGDQCSYADIEEARYGVFLRSHFLDVLRRGQEEGINNAIYLDFYTHLTKIENDVQAYRTTPIPREKDKEWDDRCWTGFFLELQQYLKDGRWKRVANPSGGFMGFWWHKRDNDNKYLQLEGKRLCFKIQVADKERQIEQRNYWHQQLMQASLDHPLKLVRPSRLAQGTVMTIAVLDGEYLRPDSEGYLDMGATVRVLKQAEEILDRIATDLPSPEHDCEPDSTDANPETSTQHSHGPAL